MGNRFSQQRSTAADFWLMSWVLRYESIEIPRKFRLGCHLIELWMFVWVTKGGYAKSDEFSDARILSITPNDDNRESVLLPENLNFPNLLTLWSHGSCMGNKSNNQYRSQSKTGRCKKGLVSQLVAHVSLHFRFIYISTFFVFFISPNAEPVQLYQRVRVDHSFVFNAHVHLSSPCACGIQ